MRVSLENVGTKYNIEHAGTAVRNDISKTGGSVRTDEVSISDNEGNKVIRGKSSITSFEEMFEEMIGGQEPVKFGKDKIVEASDLSVKELAELYLKLGINSPAGTRIDMTGNNSDSIYNAVASDNISESLSNENWIAANQTANSVNNVSYPNCNVKVPEKYVEIFQNAARKYNIAYEILVSVAKAESDFNKNDTSRSGAMGIMQLMPATAKALGVSDAYDPEQNIMGGARYLADKLEQHGSVELALAAYNAGSNAVKKYNGIPPYTETQNYVKKIKGYLGIG